MKFTELDLKLKSLFASERKIIGKIIQTISEIERSKGYLEKHQSLFAYLTKEIGYCNQSAQLRIDAARLSLRVPEVLNALNSGEVNLSNVAMLARGLRKTKNYSEATEILTKLKGTTKEEAQKIISKELDLPIVQHDKNSLQKDGSRRIETTLTAEQDLLLKKVRDLVSNINPNPTWAELMEIMAKFYLQKNSRLTVTSPGEVKNASKNPNYVPAELERRVFQNYQGCQYVMKDHTLCQSTHQLQVNHIIPIWAGGKTLEENLNLMCSRHNRFIYQKQKRAL